MHHGGLIPSHHERAFYHGAISRTHDRYKIEQHEKRMNWAIFQFSRCVLISVSRYVYVCVCVSVCVCMYVCMYIYIHWRRKRCGGGGQGGHVPPTFFIGGQWYVCAPPPPPHTLLTPHFHFPLELYVYITLTNNYLGFFIYQLIILWTISIN